MLAYKDDKDFYESLPRKRIGVGALLFYKTNCLFFNPVTAMNGFYLEARSKPKSHRLKDFIAASKKN